MANETKIILLVEDERDYSLPLTIKLEEAGYHVLPALNGEEGLKLALAQHPQLIILDLVMPKMDGVEMLMSLRKDEWGKTVQAMILTNLEDKLNLSGEFDNNLTQYLIKAAWPLDKLIEKIRATI